MTFKSAREKVLLGRSYEIVRTEYPEFPLVLDKGIVTASTAMRLNSLGYSPRTMGTSSLILRFPRYASTVPRPVTSFLDASSSATGSCSSKLGATNIALGSTMLATATLKKTELGRLDAKKVIVLLNFAGAERRVQEQEEAGCIKQLGQVEP